MLLKGIKSSCKLGVRGFRNAAWFSDKTYLHSKKDVMQDYYLRKPKDKKKILHPETKKFISQTTQPLPPLKYKLHELPEGFDFYDQLGLREDLPFRIERTQSGNLPVYRRYKQGGDVKRTEIRKISGDLDVTFITFLGLCSLC